MIFYILAKYILHFFIIKCNSLMQEQLYILKSKRMIREKLSFLVAVWMFFVQTFSYISV